VSEAAGRLRPGAREDHDDYVLCAKDSFWFRPAYTEGRCPLCGEVASGGAPAPPLFARMDRSWLGLGVLALESVGMATLVLFMYFK
jgi:hypothetical protein